MSKVEIIFTREPRPTEGGEGYEIGETYSVSPETAARWERRGAVKLIEKVKTKAKTKAKAKVQDKGDK